MAGDARIAKIDFQSGIHQLHVHFAPCILVWYGVKIHFHRDVAVRIYLSIVEPLGKLVWDVWKWFEVLSFLLSGFLLVAETLLEGASVELIKGLSYSRLQYMEFKVLIIPELGDEGSSELSDALDGCLGLGRLTSAGMIAVI